MLPQKWENRAASKLQDQSVLTSVHSKILEQKCQTKEKQLKDSKEMNSCQLEFVKNELSKLLNFLVKQSNGLHGKGRNN